MTTTILHHRKMYLFYTTLDEDDFYMKIVPLDGNYNFLVFIFFEILIVKMLKYKICFNNLLIV